ncbi:hypothetical protein, partial [Cerasicoccus arenae]|uniref:hypothetical protein n=1 Tax=Cerasicoccus arenae TaxID=424488 RepID=UPI001F327741
MRVKTGSVQSNLFDILSHVETASERKSGLDRLVVIDWESFRPVLEEYLLGLRRPEEGRTTAVVSGVDAQGADLATLLRLVRRGNGVPDF